MNIDLGRHIPAGARILVAMSGGVDSSLTAALLTRAGYQCVGVNMRTHQAVPPSARAPGRQTCCSPEDARDARAAADVAGLPFYVLDLEKEFEQAVIAPFVRDYVSGRTPNPCVLCNNSLKLGVLLHKAQAWGCDYVATGHYVRVAENTATGRMELRRAADRARDQSYYLFGLRQDQLRRLVCPLGNFTKPQVRALARELGLAVHDKPDSQEICFIPDNNYAAFVSNRLSRPAARGKFVDIHGNVLGEHKGLIHYTVGQRKGLGLSLGKPVYVIRIDAENNTVVLGEEKDVYSASLTAYDLNWIAIDFLDKPLRVKAKIRYSANEAEAVIAPIEGGRVRVDFDKPQRAVTPGQSVVFYDGDIVVGGGIIEKSEN